MAVVRLGRLVLRWCKECNLPILEAKECSECDSHTSEVKVTPPADIRPAFDFDASLIKESVDKQFGDGCGELLISSNIIILNKIPAFDRMDEIVIDGEVAGVLSYELEKGFVFMPRIYGARKFQECLKRSYVTIDDGAEKAILRHGSALIPGILEARGFERGDEVILLNERGEIIGVGRARIDSKETARKKKGVGVKVRRSEEGRKSAVQSKKNDWSKVIKANRGQIDEKVRVAKDFIRSTVEKFKMDIAVSFSGGKDSLATLLLILESGYEPKILFIDTGLEFDETKAYVRKVAEKFGLELIVGSAQDSFWENLDYFGPPSRDYRWCCKTCKLGPATRLIREHFGKGILTFIGQRSYESEQRFRKARVWRNPWVPNQVGASPIQDWTALHVWLFLFDRGIEFNPLYEKGFERIGCWLCPASDMAEFYLIRESENYRKWRAYLKKFSAERGYPEQWLEYGVWRWRSMPRVLRDKVKGIVPKNTSKERLKFYSVEGYSPCKDGLSIEGVFNSKLNLERVHNLLHILGKVELDEEVRRCFIGKRVQVYEEGAVIVRESSEVKVKALMKKVHEIIMKAMNCVGCGVCVGRCRNDALILNSQVYVDVKKCIHCGNCLGKCPVIDYGERAFSF